MFEDGEIKRVAAEMLAEFGENTEQELSVRCDEAKSQGLAVTASLWGRVLLSVEKMREDNDQSGDLQEAC